VPGTALLEELNISDSFDAATSKKYEGLSEKKRMTVMGLEKQDSEPTMILHLRSTYPL
jgi:hypothetical protein